MHHLKTTLLIAALSLSTALGATSTPVDYDHATLAVTASGSTAQAVGFTTPSTTLTISAGNGYLRPDAHYTVTVPITNTTDRSIDVTSSTAVAGSGATLVTVTPMIGSLTGLPAGAADALTFDVAVRDASDADAFAGKDVTITFTVNGSSVSAN